MVDNATVYPEIMAILPKDLKLHKEHPEYYHVKLNYITEQREGKPGEKMKEHSIQTVEIKRIKNSNYTSSSKVQNVINNKNSL
eukprot:5228134-Ditylum_brightwellii.AAC.1